MSAPAGTPCLWIDPSHGAAGDMLLGALLDAGASLEAVRAAVRAVAPEELDVQVAQVRRHGLRAARAQVLAGESPHHRTLPDVLALVAAAQLPAPVSHLVERVFTVLARAEARVHGTGVAQVHFHEVGALDAIADITGCAAALHDLGLLAAGARVVVGPLALGSGRVGAAHGSLPVPVPAVLALLEGTGAAVVAGPAPRELCTPTGAALLVALAAEWGPLPAMSVHRTGVGAGSADPAGSANVLRVVLGEEPAAGTRTAWREDRLELVEATVDDLDPRLWPDLLDALHAAGALDAWAAPVLMRKGRPGHVVSALVEPAALDSVHRALLVHGSTLGARSHPVLRRAAPRGSLTVDVDGHAVPVKLGYVDGSAVTVQPEHAESAAAASALGLPVREVLARAAALARRGEGGRPVP